MSQAKVKLPHELIRHFCERYHIAKLALFGSVLRDDFRPDSDVDILVEFEPGHTPGLLQVAHMERELRSLLGGRNVDLRTLEDLSPYFQARVLSTAETQYERG